MQYSLKYTELKDIKKKVTKMEMVVEFVNLVMNFSGFLGQLYSSCTMEQCNTL